jgi:hypothetical protein
LGVIFKRSVCYFREEPVVRVGYTKLHEKVLYNAKEVGIVIKSNIKQVYRSFIYICRPILKLKIR